MKTSNETVLQPWGLRERQWIAMGIGIVIYGIVSYLIDVLTGSSGDTPLQTVLFGLSLVVPFFFAARFGPWVGCVCALLGALIGDYVFYHFPALVTVWYVYAGLALLGFSSGFAFVRTQGQYNTRRNIITAIVTGFIGIVVFELLAVIGESITYPGNWDYAFSNLYLPFFLSSSVALIAFSILLIIYGKNRARSIS